MNEELKVKVAAYLQGYMAKAAQMSKTTTPSAARIAIAGFLQGYMSKAAEIGMLEKSAGLGEAVGNAASTAGAAVADTAATVGAKAQSILSVLKKFFTTHPVAGNAISATAGAGAGLTAGAMLPKE